MRHAVIGGGKRFRPFLLIESAKLFGVDSAPALNTAAAGEFLHCYSLVHDDLPAMDNDELRRGRPTVWKAFDEATAILAGDALLSLAFEVMARPETHKDPNVRAELVVGLARASGATGMAGGQQLDIEAEASSDPHLHAAHGVQMIQDMKTGALIRFAVDGGAILGRATGPDRQALGAYAAALGIAFQLADDLLDAAGDAATTGKSVGKDAKAGKATWVSILGVAGARSRLAELEREAIAALAPFAAAGEALAAAATFVTHRQR
jgi:farnesyl diphosphate synthase